MKLKKLVTSGILLALAMILPFFTGQIPHIGNMLLPMHIPILLAGFFCGLPYAALIGFIAPLLRFLLFGMPPLFPVGFAMAFELAAYGFVGASLYKRLGHNVKGVYSTLIFAMVGGRFVWGLVRYALSLTFGLQFTVQMFLAGALFTAIPGIIVQLIIIPPIVLKLNYFLKEVIVE